MLRAAVPFLPFQRNALFVRNAACYFSFLLYLSGWRQSCLPYLREMCLESFSKKWKGKIDK